jgi:hypothetical protein
MPKGEGELFGPSTAVYEDQPLLPPVHSGKDDRHIVEAAYVVQGDFGRGDGLGGSGDDLARLMSSRSQPGQ